MLGRETIGMNRANTPISAMKLEWCIRILRGDPSAPLVESPGSTLLLSASRDCQLSGIPRRAAVGAPLDRSGYPSGCFLILIPAGARFIVSSIL